MEWLIELIKHTPEILKAASANDLALAAFFFLVGAVLIFVLLRSANSFVKLLAIVLWLAASLVALLYFVHQKIPDPDVIARMVGQDSSVKGHAADLDLGYIAADTEYEYRLKVRLENGSSDLEIRGSDAPIQAQIASPTVESSGQVVTIKLSAPSSGKQVSILTIARSGTKAKGLTLRISYAAMPSPVSSRNDSGPKPSGNGQDTSSNYPLCVDAPAQGNYEVLSSRYWLTGDRECNHFSQCASSPGASSRQVCFVFNMQGHSECTRPFSNCDATRASEGHIEASFKLVPSIPRLTAAAS
jgi:hypothetical protein